MNNVTDFVENTALPKGVALNPSDPDEMSGPPPFEKGRSFYLVDYFIYALAI